MLRNWDHLTSEAFMCIKFLPSYSVRADSAISRLTKLVQTRPEILELLVQLLPGGRSWGELGFPLPAPLSVGPPTTIRQMPKTAHLQHLVPLPVGDKAGGGPESGWKPIQILLLFQKSSPFADLSVPRHLPETCHPPC